MGEILFRKEESHGGMFIDPVQTESGVVGPFRCGIEAILGWSVPGERRASFRMVEADATDAPV